jgi:outer membrane protein
MKKIIFFSVVLFLFTFRAYGTEVKIGYMDLNKALNESDDGKKATKFLEELVNSKQTILQEKEKEIKKLNEELEKQSAVLTPESKKIKEEQLNKLYRDYQRTAKDFQEEIQKKEEELRMEILKELREIVNKIGKEEGYSIIFETGASGILYYQKEFDLTEKIIKKYNEAAKMKK